MPKHKVCSPEGRVEQFPGKLYVSEGTLFCSACKISLAAGKRDTLLDHFKSAKHLKAASRPMQGPRQIALPQSNTSTKDVRQEFILDLVRMMTTANIPLHRVPLMSTFFRRHCSNGGVVPSASFLRSHYVPLLFSQHVTALQGLLCNRVVHVVIDETTDDRDWSMVHVLVGTGLAPIRCSAFSCPLVTQAPISTWLKLQEWRRWTTARCQG